MFSVTLNLSGRLVVVVGGGSVGSRKARAALDAGATVRVVDPAPAAELPRVTHVREPYRPDHLHGACLVFAASTPEVNAQVVADAKARGLWVNSATDPDVGDFHLPAVARVGGLSLAVSSGGASPALARRIREKLKAEFDAAFGEWVALLAELRAEALASVADPVVRRERLDALADWPWLDRLRSEGVEATRSAMREYLRAARPG